VKKSKSKKKVIAAAPKLRVRKGSAVLSDRGKLWEAFKLAKLRGALIQTLYVAQSYGMSLEARKITLHVQDLALQIGSLGLPGEAAADSFKAQIQALDGVKAATAALVSA
jgi:hypothetical protein